MRLALVALTSVVACGRMTLPPPTSTNAQRTLAGNWSVEFRLDSLKVPPGWASPWQPASFQAARGTLQLSDSSIARLPDAFHSEIDVDFEPLLGRPMSCFDPHPTSTVVSQDSASTNLWFTPGTADCGFSASGKFYGDSLVGSWSETSFVGPVVMGRFRMVRR